MTTGVELSRAWERRHSCLLAPTFGSRVSGVFCHYAQEQFASRLWAVDGEGSSCLVMASTRVKYPPSSGSWALHPV